MRSRNGAVQGRIWLKSSPHHREAPRPASSNRSRAELLVRDRPPPALRGGAGSRVSIIRTIVFAVCARTEDSSGQVGSGFDGRNKAFGPIFPAKAQKTGRLGAIVKEELFMHANRAARA